MVATLHIVLGASATNDDDDDDQVVRCQGRPRVRVARAQPRREAPEGGNECSFLIH